MKKIYLLAFVFTVLLIGCTSSQFATYRPMGSNDSNWQINVLHSSGVIGNTFKVVIDDSTVIDKDTNFLTGILEEKGTFKNKEIKLMVSYSPGFLGFGKGFEAMVFVNNELAGKFKF